MPYNRTGKITKINDDGSNSIIDFDYSVDTTKYSDIDLKEGVIFVPISSNFDIQFTRNIFANSITTATDENLIRGSVQLTHLVLSTSQSGDNNTLTLSNKARPSSIIESSVNEVFEDDIVIMGEYDINNDIVNITPKVNLSSNTVYFLNLSPDNIRDYNEKKISFSVGNGFMTDNSRSFYLNDYNLYKGFSVSVDDDSLSLNFLELPSTTTSNEVILVNRRDENGNIILTDDGQPLKEPKQIVSEVTNDVDLESFKINFSEDDDFYLFREGDTKSTYNINKPLFGKIKNVNNNSLHFMLDYSCYHMNVSYSSSGTDTKVTTIRNHNLLDDDVIRVFDVVSGDIQVKDYTIKKIDSKNFTINYDISSKRSGNLNYHPKLKINHKIVNVKNSGDGVVVSKKIIKTNQNISQYTGNVINTKFNTVLYSNPLGNGVLTPDTSDQMSGRFIRIKDRVANYVPVNQDDQIVTDGFVNNSIIEFFDNNEKIMGHIKANTYPSHNVHPFNTSAPKISEFYPSEGVSTTSKIKITQITRVADVATVFTNVKHTLSAGDHIYIEGFLNTIFTGLFTVSTILNDTSFEYIITDDVDENSAFRSNQQLKLLFFNSNVETTESNLSDTDNYSEKSSVLQITFSQSMNTSSVSVANDSHLMVANGSVISFSGDLNKSSSTIQISKSGTDFTDDALISFDRITANTGNAQFTIYPTNLDKFSTYYVRVTNSISDLGGTKLTYNYTMRDPITTGTRPNDIENISDEPFEIPIYDLDTVPPKVKKIYFSNLYSNSHLNQIVLDSLNYNQISDPLDYKEAEVDLNGESIVVLFDESIDSSTVVVNTQNTRPIGTVQLSCDDFLTVVQMEEPVISTTTNQFDTFTFRPVANLSSNSTYKLKVTRGVGDLAINKNFLAGDNITNIRSMVLDTGPDAQYYYTPGETIRGTRRLFVNTTLNLPDVNFSISGLQSGKIFYGLTSGGRGKVYSYETQNISGIDTIVSIDYTPIETGRYIIDLKRGETCYFEDDNSYRFSINYTAITPAPEGIVIRYISDEKRLIYREVTPLYTFDKSNDRVYGYQSKGIGSTSDPYDTELAGFKTGVENNQVAYYAKDVSDNILTNSSGNVLDISPNTEIIFKFSQTMNTETFSYNTLNKTVNSNHNIILSYDSNFSNCIPFNMVYDKSNNDTTFTFTPSLYLNNFQLSQNSLIYVKASNTTLTKGGTESVSSGHTNYFKISNQNNFKILNVYVYAQGLREELIEYVQGEDNSVSNILTSSFIEITFNETVDPTTLTIGQGNSVELSTDSNFSSGFISSGTITTMDLDKNRIILTPASYFLNLTDYYLRINTSIKNPYGVSLNKTYTFDKFTIE